MEKKEQPIVEIVLPTRAQKKKPFLPPGVAKIQIVKNIHDRLCTVMPQINREVVNLGWGCEPRLDGKLDEAKLLE